jgi:hypothetical protein
MVKVVVGRKRTWGVALSMALVLERCGVLVVGDEAAA